MCRDCRLDNRRCTGDGAEKKEEAGAAAFDGRVRVTT
jgi:hypothetical protein